MGLTDALNRISQIEAQIAALKGGAPPTPATASTPAAPSASDASGGASPSFAATLAQAQASSAAAPAAALSASARRQLTSGQQEFASRLAAQTGLNPQVVAAWLLAEESGGAAASRQSAGNNDWLNIGYTDSGTFGASDSVWSNPDSAADATAGWLKGQSTVPGYGPASAGIRSILGTASQSPEAQIAAIQRSGWASSGYPDLPGLYQQVSA